MANHEWTPEEKLTVWNKATIVEGRDPKEWRMDPCGDLIRWDDYADEGTCYGWEIDHVVPQSVLERLGIPDGLIHHIRNLRPMQSSTNARKSDDYPRYQYSRMVLGQEVARTYDVNPSLQRDLRYLFGEYLGRDTHGVAALPQRDREWIDRIFGDLPKQDHEWLERTMHQRPIDFPDLIANASVYDLD